MEYLHNRIMRAFFNAFAIKGLLLVHFQRNLDVKQIQKNSIKPTEFI